MCLARAARRRSALAAASCCRQLSGSDRNASSSAESVYMRAVEAAGPATLMFTRHRTSLPQSARLVSEGWVVLAEVDHECPDPTARDTP